MKYTKKILEDKRIQLTINVEKKEWDEALEKAYNENKGKYNIQGFRKGHAPRKVIEKTYGDTVFYDDAIDGCFYRYYLEVLSKEKDVKPVGHPEINIDKIDDNGLQLTLKITNTPAVELGAYTGIEIKGEKPKVTKEEVEHELEHLRESRVKFVPVDREAKNGDTVTIDFSGSIDGVKFDGGTANDFDLELGSHSFIDNFEDQLVGTKKDDKKDVVVTFPKDYPAENLSGKKATFAVTVKEVKEKVMPELNDKFADEVSEFSTLKELEEGTKKKLLERKEKEEKSKAESKLIDQIVENAKVEIPEVMVLEQIDEFIHDFEHRLSYQGLNLDGYLKYANTTLEELKKSRVDDAKRTVKTRLVLEQIMTKENLNVTDEDLVNKYNEHTKEKAKTLDDLRKNMSEEQFNYFANSLLLNKLMKFLKDNNKID